MRTLFFFCVLLFTSCHHNPWKNSSLSNGNERYDMAKLTYSCPKQKNELELELIRCGKEVYGYINTLCFELPRNKDDHHTTTLKITTDSGIKTFTILLLEGRKRARLSDTCLEYLLQNLELKSLVTLSCGHFSQILDTSNFQRSYDALMRKPPLIQPRSMIHLELF